MTAKIMPSKSAYINRSQKQSLVLTVLQKKPFENIVGKGENAGNQHFLLFPQCFSCLSEIEIIIQSTLKL